MSLATRCTACGTAFRVVQDQLKVSEGWVRCGRCNEVFNALEGLFDLGRDVPSGWSEHSEPLAAPAAQPDSAWEQTLRAAPPSQSAGSASAAEASSRTGSAAKASSNASPSAERHARSRGDHAPRHAPAAEGDDEPVAGDDSEGSTTDLGELLADPIDAHLFGPRKRQEAAPKPAGELDRRDRVEFSDARFDSDLFADNTSVPDTELVVLPATDAGALPLESSARPEFVRRADRRARWQSGPARAVLGFGAVLGAGVLALQVANHWRDTIAAQWPSLRTPLVAWCRLAQCRIEAPRHIEDVLVDSTALTRASTPDAFILSVTLKSRSALPLGTPSLDLTLTDATGGLVARRALSPRDLNAADVLPPHSETALQVQLTAGTAPVVGYTVEIFYP